MTTVYKDRRTTVTNTSSHTRAIIGSLASTVALAWTGPLLAQDQVEDDAEGLNTIVVTAQTREQKLQDVPIQVAAFDEQQIEDAGITSTQDFIGSGSEMFMVPMAVSFAARIWQALPSSNRLPLPCSANPSFISVI